MCFSLRALNILQREEERVGIKWRSRFVIFMRQLVDCKVLGTSTREQEEECTRFDADVFC